MEGARCCAARRLMDSCLHPRAAVHSCHEHVCAGFCVDMVSVLMGICPGVALLGNILQNCQTVSRNGCTIVWAPLPRPHVPPVLGTM